MNHQLGERGCCRRGDTDPSSTMMVENAPHTGFNCCKSLWASRGDRKATVVRGSVQKAITPPAALLHSYMPSLVHSNITSLQVHLTGAAGQLETLMLRKKENAALCDSIVRRDSVVFPGPGGKRTRPTPKFGANKEHRPVKQPRSRCCRSRELGRRKCNTTPCLKISIYFEAGCEPLQTWTESLGYWPRCNRCP